MTRPSLLNPAVEQLAEEISKLPAETLQRIQAAYPTPIEETDTEGLSDSPSSSAQGTA